MVLGLVQRGVVLTLLCKLLFPLQIGNLPEYQLKIKLYINLKFEIEF